MLQQNRFFVESPHPEILRQLLRDPVIKAAAVPAPGGAGAGGGGGAAGDEGLQAFRVGAARRDRAVADLARIEEIDLAAEGGALGVRSWLAGAAVALGCVRRDLEQLQDGCPLLIDYCSLTYAGSPTLCSLLPRLAEDEPGGSGPAQPPADVAAAGQQQGDTQQGQQPGQQQQQQQQPSYMLDAVEEDPDKELHSFEVNPEKVRLWATPVR